MTIEIKPGRYIHGIWFAGNGKMDWMGCLWREGDGPWQLDYRMRYYAGPSPHDPNDRKSWYHVEFSKDAAEDKVAEDVAFIGNLIAETMPMGKGKLEFMPYRCDGGDPSVPHLIRATPWMHSRKPTPEEEKEWGLNDKDGAAK